MRCLPRVAGPPSAGHGDLRHAGHRRRAECSAPVGNRQQCQRARPRATGDRPLAPPAVQAQAAPGDRRWPVESRWQHRGRKLDSGSRRSGHRIVRLCPQSCLAGVRLRRMQAPVQPYRPLAGRSIWKLQAPGEETRPATSAVRRRRVANQMLAVCTVYRAKSIDAATSQGFLARC